MLHPGVRRDDEEAGKPRSNEHHEGRPPVPDPRKARFAEQEQAEERRLEEEGEYALHGERLGDDSAGQLRESRPVGPELKFHRNAGDYARDEIDPEDFRPEASG